MACHEPEQEGRRRHYRAEGNNSSLLKSGRKAAFFTLLSFIRYKKVEKQIDEDTYQPSLILDIMLVLAVLVIGIFLVTYLVHSI